MQATDLRRCLRSETTGHLSGGLSTACMGYKAKFSITTRPPCFITAASETSVTTYSSVSRTTEEHVFEWNETLGKRHELMFCHIWNGVSHIGSQGTNPLKGESGTSSKHVSGYRASIPIYVTRPQLLGQDGSPYTQYLCYGTRLVEGGRKGSNP